MPGTPTLRLDNRKSLALGSRESLDRRAGGEAEVM
jgi:hypothetical protein